MKWQWGVASGAEIPHCWIEHDGKPATRLVLDGIGDMAQQLAQGICDKLNVDEEQDQVRLAAYARIYSSVYAATALSGDRAAREYARRAVEDFAAHYREQTATIGNFS